MKNHNENFEMVKKIILNEQLGSPEDLKLVVVKNSLSDFDKERIKQAVLKAVENGCLEPDLIANRCCIALECINKYNKSTGDGQYP